MTVGIFSVETAVPETREGPRLVFGSRASLPGPAPMATPASVDGVNGYAVKELPQPQPPVALGFLKVKPEPCMDET